MRNVSLNEFTSSRQQGPVQQPHEATSTLSPVARWRHRSVLNEGPYNDSNEEQGITDDTLLIGNNPTAAQ